MNIGIIGRNEVLFETMQRLKEAGHNIKFVVTSKASPEYKIKHADFEQFAAAHQIPYLYHPNVTAEALKELIGNNSSEVVISTNYTGVIAHEITELFPLGILNAHGGDLPRYRGNACQAWALINAEKRIGLCIHRMIGGELDSGDILERQFFEVNVNTRIGEVYEWMQELIPDMFVKTIEKLSDDPKFILERQSKDPAQALRCYPRMPDDGRINWKKSNYEVLRLINASSEPFSGAFSYLDNEKITIWRAELVEDEENYLGVPGQISAVHQKGWVEVLAGSGKVRLLEVEKDTRTLPSQLIKSIRKRFR